MLSDRCLSLSVFLWLLPIISKSSENSSSKPCPISRCVRVNPSVRDICRPCGFVRSATSTRSRSKPENESCERNTSSTFQNWNFHSCGRVLGEHASRKRATISHLARTSVSWTNTTDRSMGSTRSRWNSILWKMPIHSFRPNGSVRMWPMTIAMGMEVSRGSGCQEKYK